MPHKDVETRREYQRKRVRTPEQRSAKLQRQYEWYLANKESHLARCRAHNAKPETKARKRAYVENNREMHREWSRAYRARHPGSRKGEWAKLNAEQRKDKQLKSAYGISLAEYNRMFVAQNGVCAICQNPPARKYFDVDHDHGTGAVRGLLCRTCNTGVGYLEHLEPNHIQAARDYLSPKLKVMA